jgi:hypothetical protein
VVLLDARQLCSEMVGLHTVESRNRELLCVVAVATKLEEVLGCLKTLGLFELVEGWRDERELLRGPVRVRTPGGHESSLIKHEISFFLVATKFGGHQIGCRGPGGKALHRGQ